MLPNVLALRVMLMLNRLSKNQPLMIVNQIIGKK